MNLSPIFNVEDEFFFHYHKVVFRYLYLDMTYSILLNYMDGFNTNMRSLYNQIVLSSQQFEILWKTLLFISNK